MRAVVHSVLVALLAAFASPQTIERVSIASGGGQGNGESPHVVISADGRFVAFDSYSSNLTDGDLNGVLDVFLRDRQSGETIRITSNGAGSPPDGVDPSISADGRLIAYVSNTTGDVYIYNRISGTTARVTVGNAGSGYARISADGTCIAFLSTASNLVTGDTNGSWDVFEYGPGGIERVSVSSAGVEGNGNSDNHAPAISADGRYVAFGSFASNLVTGDTNGVTDVFVHDRQTLVTTCASVSSGGGHLNNDSMGPAISSDGRYVAFESLAWNAVAGDANGKGDVFVHDQQTGQTSIVSISSAGVQGDGESWWPSISADGRFVTFNSNATTLASVSANGTTDVYLRDRTMSRTTCVSVSAPGFEGNADSTFAHLSPDGRYVCFVSSASDLVAGDTNGRKDAFLCTRPLDVDPTAFTYNIGSLRSGGVSDLVFSDDLRLLSYVSYAGSRIQPNLQVDVFGATTVNASGRLDVEVESACNKPGTTQKIYAYDYVTPGWVLLDTSSPLLSDTTRSVSVTTNVSRYLSGSELKLRIEVKDSAAASSRLMVSIDRVHWTVGP